MKTNDSTSSKNTKYKNMSIYVYIQTAGVVFYMHTYANIESRTHAKLNTLELELFNWQGTRGSTE